MADENTTKSGLRSAKPTDLTTIREKLENQMAEYAARDICLAFSGGVDSSLLLKAAVQAAEHTGRQVWAVTFDSRLHPSCDLEIAGRVAAELGGIHRVITVDELEQEEIRNNPVDRCYLCKRHLFSTLKAFAGERGIDRILDGTNEDDMHVYRPGIRGAAGAGHHQPPGGPAHHQGPGQGAGRLVRHFRGFPPVHSLHGHPDSLQHAH